MISGVSGVMSHFTPTVIFFPLKVENIKVMSTAQFTQNQTGREIRDPSFPETWANRLAPGTVSQTGTRPSWKRTLEVFV